MNAFELAQAPCVVSSPRARIWVHSDLQLPDPTAAKAILRGAVEDLLLLGEPIDAIWCLGDAICGGQVARQEQLADIVITELGRLGVPVCYVMGNHEMDLMRIHGILRHPLYERAQAQDLWHVTCHLEEAFFVRTFCGIPVVFFSDQAARNGKWWMSHIGIHGDATSRQEEEVFLPALRDVIARHPGPVLTAGHYALPGGQRALARMGGLFPLPANLLLHLYGHAHIGDLRINRENPWLRRNPVQGHDICQYNVSALENVRSPGSHSAILELNQNGPVSLEIRCHLERRWMERFDFAPIPVNC